MELLVEPSCQYVTWKVRDFLHLPSKIGYFLDSPEIRFADDIYCLRLYPNGDKKYQNVAYTDLYLERLTFTGPKRNASFKIGPRWRSEIVGEYEIYRNSRTSFNNFGFRLPRSILENDTDVYIPDGTYTAICSMHLREQSRAESPQSEEDETSDSKEEQERLTGQSASFSSCWKSSKMELSIESPCHYVTWKIRDFFQLPSEIGYSVDSPEIHFAGDNYCLRLYPNGNRNGDTDFIDLQLVRLTSTFPERIVLYKVGYSYKTENGDEFDVCHCPGTLQNESGSCLSRTRLEKRRYMYVPDKTFTVLCCMRLREESIAGCPQSEEAGSSVAEEMQEGLPGVARLQSDYRQLLEKGAESDACIVVSGKEFPAHRCVLRARSTVFEAMFGHETSEKVSGRVVIEDFDPEIFGKFLEYLYTGSVGAGLSDDNAFGLYAAADKYDVTTLKSECVAHMRRTLSVDSFCDVMTLALRHREEDLLQQAIQFFKKNMQLIILTVKWQVFLIENGTSANELLIKALVPGGQ